MKLMEVKDSFQTAEDNQYQTADKDDTRRPRLTLKHLGKLRKMREIRKLENEDRKELFKKIYARPSNLE